ncbi:uncharacterized protein LOC135144552 [Zophobas morio]|uniref:uncharacterized protein LOC135144552 n=1 Tax=Zophobas morio TaxID=2755281 RepID=UPI0030839B7B
MSIVELSFFVFFSQYGAVKGFYTNLLKPERANRHCHDSSAPIPSVLPSEESKFSLCLILISGLLFFLLFLGAIKGLIGLFCWDKIGMYGLNLLIELPRPLSRYQEKSLEHRPVVYDIGGWPIHPDSLQRTVRVLPKRTEFCLNLVFFLAYPLAACVYVCAFCCCIRNLSKSKENACFKHVDVVRLTQGKNQQVKTNGAANVGVYKEDYKEEQDTKYVIETMKKSKESIHEYRNSMCECDE